MKEADQTQLDVEEVTTRAVQAALGVIDTATRGTGKKSDGPLGDDLAYALHRTIEAALENHLKPQEASDEDH